MDVSHILNGIHFVWDDTKAIRNIHKHSGVSFEQAAQAFFDPFIRMVDASRNNEERDAIIGMDNNWQLLFVVHIQFEDDKIRLISAREATRTERKLYED